MGSKLIFAGLAGIRDPPLKEVRQAIEDCRDAVIRECCNMCLAMRDHHTDFNPNTAQLGLPSCNLDKYESEHSSISSEAPKEPVVSTKSGLLFERWLIGGHISKMYPDVSAQLLEYEKHFEHYGSDFTFYDYNLPEDLPQELKHGYQIIVIDPPYLRWIPK